MAQFTFHSCLDIKDLFIPMFGEQEVLSKFSLRKTKYTYITNYEIAPYFKESLTQCIKESPFYSTLLNMILGHSKSLRENSILQFSIILPTKC